MRATPCVAGLLLLGVAAPGALARDDFFGRTVGSFVFEDAEPPVLTGTLEQFFITFKGPVVFEFLVMSFEITRQEQGPDQLRGTLTFLGSDPADTLSGAFDGINFPNEDGIWTGSGSWTASEGTGAFVGLGGDGTFTTALFTNDGSAATAFDGQIIPGPSSAAPLAILLLAARRRR